MTGRPSRAARTFPRSAWRCTRRWPPAISRHLQKAHLLRWRPQRLARPAALSLGAEPTHRRSSTLLRRPCWLSRDVHALGEATHSGARLADDVLDYSPAPGRSWISPTH